MRKLRFSTQRYLQHQNEIQRPPAGRGGREWVLSRGLCHYRCFDLTDIPLGRRDEALQLQIQQWSPFTHSGSYSVWRQSQAQTWVWDQDQQQQVQQAQAVRQARLLPEGVLRAPLTEGLRLLTCLDGLEGQVWREGVLQASHWWQTTPSLQAWQRFQRAQGLPATPVPSPLSLPLLDKPWGRARTASGIGGLRQERVWVFGLAALGLSALVWQSVGIWQWRQALDQVASQIDSLNARTTPVLEARSQAMTDRLAIETLLALNPYPHQLQLLAEVADRLPAGVRLLEWHYQTGQLNFTLEAPSLDPRFYVTAFQAVPGFLEVKANTGRTPQQLIVSLRVAKGTHG